MNKVIRAADYRKGETTIGELINLPNRLIHYLWRESVNRSIEAQKNPDGPAAKEMQNQALADALTGQG
jgi:hypothetical protein